MRWSSSSSRTSSRSSNTLLGALQERSEPPTTPQVLTASSIQALTSSFDARDTLECYLLTREAHLHGLANSTLPIHKLALGLRYHPSQNNNLNLGRRRKALELTLEYGPARAGAGLLEETIPQLVTPSSSTEGNEQDAESSQVVLEWNNEAVVYYTLRIDGYRSANYVASMTGAVLKNLLQTAVAYPHQRSRRRYQPFAVYRHGNPSSSSSSSSSSTEDPSSTSSSSSSPDSFLLLRSSSDLDFLNALWQHLAEVGVELKPVILPPRYRIHLMASSIHKVTQSPPATTPPSTDSSSQPQQPQPHRINDFYLRFYQCIEAIATANYSAFDTMTSTTTTTNATRSRLTTDVSSLPTTIDVDPEPERQKKSNPGKQSQSLMTTPAPSIVSNATTLNNSNTFNSSQQAAPPEQQQQEEESSQSQPDTNPNPLVPPIDTTDQVAQDAQQAAQDAETAAQEAQNSGNEQAAQAAQAAADAAKKAADSTRGQAAMVAQKALLSGDGASMAEAMSQCLTSPRYGLARNDSNVTTVYLYWDGTVYYAINLTAPYIQVVAETSQLPRLSQQAVGGALSMGDGGGDYVDWAIAFVVMLLFVIGFLCLIQKVLGRKLQFNRSLYRFQRWFFDPLHYTFDDVTDSTAWDMSDKMDRQAQGHTYTFAEDVIPLSMGGRIRWGTDFILGSVTTSNHDHSNENGADELEMIVTRPNKLSDEFFPEDEHDEDEPMLLSRSLTNSPSPHFLRNPDFVALPDLTRSSKVAVPISLRSSSLHSQDEDELDLDEKKK